MLLYREVAESPSLEVLRKRVYVALPDVVSGDGMRLDWAVFVVFSYLNNSAIG